MHSRVCVISISLLSVTSGKPLSLPEPDDATGFLDLWPSDGGFFTEPTATLESSYDYSMFSDSDANLSGFAMDSDGENMRNLVTSCVDESNIDPFSGLDILKPRDSLAQMWTTLEPSTEQKLCPANRDPQPPPEIPPLMLPFLNDYADTEECPPLPDGRKRQALCCYDPDVQTPNGDSVSKNCWRCQYI